jgi:hypothetical protein
VPSITSPSSPLDPPRLVQVNHVEGDSDPVCKVRPFVLRLERDR